MKRGIAVVGHAEFLIEIALFLCAPTLALSGAPLYGGADEAVTDNLFTIKPTVKRSTCTSLSLRTSPSVDHKQDQIHLSSTMAPGKNGTALPDLTDIFKTHPQPAVLTVSCYIHSAITSDSPGNVGQV